jgi:hypothetical protein
MQSSLSFVLSYVWYRSVPEKFTSLTNNPTWINDKKEIDPLVREALNRKYDAPTKALLKERLASFQPHELDQHIKAVAGSDLKSTNYDSLEDLDNMIQLLTLEQIEQAIGSTISNNFESIETARSHLEETRHYFQTHKKEPFKGTLYISAAYLIKAVHMIVQATFISTGINKLFDKARDCYGCQLFVMMKVFSELEKAIETFAKSSIGTEDIALSRSRFLFTKMCKYSRFVTSALLISTGLGYIIYQNYLRPAPSDLTGSTDLSDLASLGLLVGTSGRQEEKMQLARRFQSAGKQCTVIVAPPKTKQASALVKAFTQDLVDHPDRHPELVGKKVLFMDTAKYSEPSSTDFENFLTETKHQHENMILYFDHFHLASDRLINRIRLLGELNGISPGIILGTTAENYQKLIDGGEWTDSIEVLDLVTKDENREEEALENELAVNMPDISMEERVIHHLVNEVKKYFPDDSLSERASALLSQACHIITQTPLIKLDKELAELMDKQKRVLSQNSLKRRGFFERQTVPSLNKAQTEIKAAKLALESLHKWQEYEQLAKKALYKLTRKVAKLKPEEKKRNEPLIKEYLKASYIYEAFCKAVDQVVHSNELKNVYTCLDFQLIDDLIQNELNARESNQKSSLKGKEKV